MASAARKDLDLFELLASASNRFFVPASMRMESVSVVGTVFPCGHCRMVYAVIDQSGRTSGYQGLVNRISALSKRAGSEVAEGQPNNAG